MDNSFNKTLGDWGEDCAARYLQKRGLRIVDRQYLQKWGEIDLIARHGETWVFVEVKTRSSVFFLSAVHSVTVKKQLRMLRAALSYMKWKRLEGCAFRFDLILIEAGQVEWIRDAFDASSRYTY